MTNDDTITEASAELAATLEPQRVTPSQMREAIEQYHAMTRDAIARFVDPLDGEIVEIPMLEYEKLVASHKAFVKKAMRDNDEKRVQLEGMPAIKLQPGSGAWSWSVDAWYENEHDRDDLIDLIKRPGAMAVNAKRAGELSGAGEIKPTWRRYGVQGSRDDALVWETR